MSIETPNFYFAGGFFDGFDPPQNPTGRQIITARGFQPFNPLTTPGEPIGGFTRFDVSAYQLRTQVPFDTTECICHIDCFLVVDNDNPNFCIAGGAPFEGDVQVLGNGLNDAQFYVSLFHLAYDDTGGISF